MIHLRLLLALVAISLPSCMPGTVTREQAVATAWTYSEVQWTPRPAHRFHGLDSEGILVHTPDHQLAGHGLNNGWWKPDQTMKGMPYKWGGFDTPESFQRSLEKGRYAGDISTREKRRLGDHAVSKQTTGIDCSGFVSRCWNLPRPYSTKQLPSITTELASWDELKPGDILLNDRHVVLFARWEKSGKSIYAYEAGPYPVWRVNAAALNRDMLLANGYAPRRYKNIRD